MQEVYCIYADEKKLFDLNYVFKNIKFSAIGYEDIKLGMDAMLLICSINRRKEIESQLQQKGMQEYKDYMYISEFARNLNYLYWRNTNKQVLIWGAGNITKEVLSNWENLYSKDLISGIIDNNCSINDNKTLYDIPIVHPSMISDWEKYIVVISVNDAYKEIEAQLMSIGLEREVNYIGWKTVMTDVASLFLETFFDKRHSTNICKLPFGFVDIIGDRVYCCCPDEMKYISVGNLSEISLKSAWQSAIAEVLRCSILNGTYSFCDEDICEARFELQKEKVIEENVASENILAEELPKEILVGVDYTCNLHCPSCREKIFVANEEQLSSVRKIAEEIVSSAHKEVNRIWLAGNGEVFASKVYRELLMDKRIIETGRIGILSNGTLLSKENFEKYLSVYKNIDVILSVDGARKETIEKLRRGAVYEKLAANLEYLGELRKKKIINSLQINFVLQAANVSELKEMISWCEKNHVDRIKIHKLINVLQWTKEEYIEKGVIDEYDRIKPEYNQYFDEEVLNHPICDWAMMKEHVDGLMQNSLFDGEYTVIM